MTIDHDSSYKHLFAISELVRDLILGFVPDEWLHTLDYTTLEKIPGSYTPHGHDLRLSIEGVINGNA